MTASVGYIPLFRKFKEAWQYSSPAWRSAWVTLLVEASWADQPERGLKFGQLWLSTRKAARAWGMSEASVRRFLRRAEVEKDIVWERGKGGGWHGNGKGNIHCVTDAVNDGVNDGVLDAVSDAARSRITLLNFELYHQKAKKRVAVLDAVSVAVCDRDSDAVLKEEEKEEEKKKKITQPPGPRRDLSADDLSDSTRIYNWFVRGRRQRLDLPDWLPTKAIAVQMRKNIGELLKTYPVRDLLDWMEGFFDDDYAIKINFPWGLYAKDPTAYKTTTTGNRTTAPDPERYFNE